MIVYHTVENTNTGEIKFFSNSLDIIPFLEKENGSYYCEEKDDTFPYAGPWIESETVKSERY